jgi:hypothetical protein
VGGSGPGASGSVELQEKAGSARDRSEARFGRVGAWGGAWFLDAPARSVVRGSGPRGGMLRQPWLEVLLIERALQDVVSVWGQP